MPAQTIRVPKRGSVNIPPRTLVRPRFDLDDDFSDVQGDWGIRYVLENKAADRHYVFVHDNPETQQQFMMDPVGWKVETFAGYERAPVVEDGKPKLDENKKVVMRDDLTKPLGVYVRGTLGVVKEGDRITVADHVLMSCDLEKKEKREFYQAHKYEIERRKLRDADGADVYAGWGEQGDEPAPRRRRN